MCWQTCMYEQIVTALGDLATVRLHGSAGDPQTLDGWSDLDLDMTLAEPVPITRIVGDCRVWAYDDTMTPDRQVCRVVLEDGRRLDLSVRGAGRITGLASDVADGGDTDDIIAATHSDNRIRFVAAVAVGKLGRGDLLIGAHLTYDLLRECLVRAMLLRDRDESTTVHRTGAARDSAADAVREIAAAPLTVTPRPGPVERAVRLYGTWRAELEAGYRPDWTGLDAVIERGLTGL